MQPLMTPLGANGFEQANGAPNGLTNGVEQANGAAAVAAPVAALVERFDIEPFSDFSVK